MVKHDPYCRHRARSTTGPEWPIEYRGFDADRCLYCRYLARELRGVIEAIVRR